MRIINIIDRFDKVNFGIWNAAIATAEELSKKYGIKSELWFPESSYSAKVNEVELIAINLKEESPETLIKKRNLNPQQDIIVTHGCWQYPTRWGNHFKKLGFCWMYVPHGMLEPWSMQQKWIQKKIYFHLFEKRFSQKAHVIRAVGSPEFNNLCSIYRNVLLIPNGTEIPQINAEKSNEIRQYLFMARLHHKKGILPLVKAWKNSSLKNSKNKLVIAGPNDGELLQLKEEIKEANNISYVGAVYGSEKKKLLEESHFYVLPSYSEGFPTSVVEAMSFGLIPLISEGCNFPEAFQKQHAIKLSPEEKHIITALQISEKITQDEFLSKSKNCHLFIKENYSIEKIAELQAECYRTFIEHR